MRRIGLYVAAAVSAAALVAGCSSDDSDAAKGRTTAPAGQEASPDKEVKAPDEAEASRDVRITSSGYRDHEVWGPGSYVVAYEITNNGSQPANYFAGLEFLDQDGDVLGSTGVTADKLGPGKAHRGDTAPLEAEIKNGSPKDIKSVRVSEVLRTPVK